MPEIKKLIDYNNQWADRKQSQDPNFFKEMAKKQTPLYLWIGCSDSRVPSNHIVGLLPGEIFVHRNIANLVYSDDINCQSVLKYAVDVLKVKHIIVCGHYGCGGIESVLSNIDNDPGETVMDTWLRQVREIALEHRAELEALEENKRLSRLCELNVITQTRNVLDSQTYKDAISRGQNLQVHSWIYDIHNGKIITLERYRVD